MAGKNFRLPAAVVGFPGDDKIVAGALCNRCVFTAADEHFVAIDGAFGVEPPRDNTPCIAGGIVALPCNNRAAGVHVDAGKLLVPGRGGIDGKLVAHSRGVDRKTLCKNAAAAAVLVLARPGNEKTSAGVHGNRGMALVALGGRVHQKLIARGGARVVETTGINARRVAVLAGACPGDNKITVPAGRGIFPHGNRREVLVGGGVLVDAKLTALRLSGGVVATGIDAVTAAVLIKAGPSDHEIAVRIHGNRGERLGAERGEVYLKLLAYIRAV